MTFRAEPFSFRRLSRSVAAVVLIVTVPSCQTVRVHPRIRDGGPGLERYKTVAIECSGRESQTLRQRLEAACGDLGYTVVTGAGDLNLSVFVSENKNESVAGQVLMIFLIVWNFGVGDAVFRADAKLVEAATGDVLLEFSARRTGLTNYDATRTWVSAFKSNWRRYTRVSAGRARVGQRRIPCSPITLRTESRVHVGRTL